MVAYIMLSYAAYNRRVGEAARSSSCLQHFHMQIMAKIFVVVLKGIAKCAVDPSCQAAKLSLQTNHACLT